VPFGTTIREIVYDIGGGIPKGKKLKAVHFGGPMGGSIPESLLDTPLDFDELSKLGASIGAGSMLVLDEDTSMVDLARYFLHFLSNESCGKCVPCREGIRQMLRILNNICDGKGKEGDIELLGEIAEVTGAASLCALGKTAADPLLSTLRYFRDEYEANIDKVKSPAEKRE
jgi:NADP-reducing hydrogenase subunit HndC